MGILWGCYHILKSICQLDKSLLCQVAHTYNNKHVSYDDSHTIPYYVCTRYRYLTCQYLLLAIISKVIDQFGPTLVWVSTTHGVNIYVSLRAIQLVLLVLPYIVPIINLGHAINCSTKRPKSAF